MVIYFSIISNHKFMKKFIIAILIFLMLLSPVYAVKAQTSDELKAQLIATLIEMIKSLQAQLAEMIAQQQVQNTALQQIAVNAAPSSQSVAIRPPVTTTTASSCTPNWKCSDWNKCADLSQSRTCNDSNNCDVLIDKPVLLQSCVSVGTLTATYDKLFKNDIRVLATGNTFRITSAHIITDIGTYDRSLNILIRPIPLPVQDSWGDPISMNSFMDQFIKGNIISISFYAVDNATNNTVSIIVQ